MGEKHDCIYWHTGCGEPMLKPRRARRYPGDLYYPSFCDYCRDYKPSTTIIEDRLNDLEAEASFRGSIPRRYTEELQQLKVQVLFLQNKVYEMRVKRAKKEQDHY